MSEGPGSSCGWIRAEFCISNRAVFRSHFPESGPGVPIFCCWKVGPAARIWSIVLRNARPSRQVACSLFQESACKLLRKSSGSPFGMRCSISRWVRSHTGTARASRLSPLAVRIKIRFRRSEGFWEILTNPRRSKGFKAAVRVVRSMASREATGPIGGGSGRFNDISRENCPLVSPKGRRTSSNRRAKARAARCTWRQRQ